MKKSETKEKPNKQKPPIPNIQNQRDRIIFNIRFKESIKYTKLI